jgi:hypothetical protein
MIISKPESWGLLISLVRTQDISHPLHLSNPKHYVHDYIHTCTFFSIKNIEN